MIEQDYELSPFQVEFMRRKDEPLVILQTGVGAGKSRALAWWCVYMARKGVRILAVAQNFTALMDVLYREIEIVCSVLNIEFEKTKKVIKIGEGRIYGATGENPKGILGYTDFTAAVFDEAAYLKRDVYNFVCDRLRGQHVTTPMYRYTSSPSTEAASLWFRELCESNPECVIRASSLDNAFTSNQYKLDLIKRYGIGTALYKQQVLGEFLDSDLEDTLFKHEILSTVQSRRNSSYFMDDFAVIGLDCARFGGDYTVGVLRIGYNVVKIIRARNTDTGQQVDIVRQLKNYCQYDCNVHLDAVCVDAAYGSGAIDMLRQLGYRVFEVNFAENAVQRSYYNTRAEMYFTALEWCKVAGHFEDDELVADLSAQRYMLEDGGKFRLVPKEIIKKAIERSPDTSDAFALTFYHRLESIGIDFVKKRSIDTPEVRSRMRAARISRTSHKFDFS